MAATNFLPVNRWGSASGIHTRLDAKIGADLHEKVARNGVIGGGLAAGNAMWSGASGMVEFATRFCLADNAGTLIDSILAQVGGAIMSSGLTAAIVAGFVAFVLWRAFRRGESPIRSLVSGGIVTVLFVVMIGGAMAGTRFSPGHLATAANQAISTLANAPANALVELAEKSADTRPDTANGSMLSCDQYTKGLVQRYTAAYTSWRADGTSVSLDSSQAVVPKALDRMWQETGLQAYIKAQFGSANGYGREVFCRLLERQVNTPTSDTIVTVTTGGQYVTAGTPVAPNEVAYDVTMPGQKTLTMTAPGASGVSTTPAPAGAINPVDALAWYWPNGVQQDRGIVGWAACRWNGSTWSVDPGFAAITTDHKVTVDDCTKWWTDTGFDGGETSLNWEDSADTIAQEAGTTAPAVADFLYNLHGNTESAAVATVLLYDVAAAVMFCVFVPLAIIIILAKVAMVFLTIGLILGMLFALVSGQDPLERVLGSLRNYGSVTVFATSAMLLLSVIALMTTVIQTAGVAVAGAGSAVSVLWTAVAPIGGVLLTHQLFTRVLKAPSPFKLGSAKAYMGAAAGGALVGSQMSRMSRYGRYARWRAMDSMGIRRMSRMGHQDLGDERIGGLSPVRTAAVGGAAGAVAGAVVSRHGRDDRDGEERDGGIDPAEMDRRSSARDASDAAASEPVSPEADSEQRPGGLPLPDGSDDSDGDDSADGDGVDPAKPFVPKTWKEQRNERTALERAARAHARRGGKLVPEPDAKTKLGRAFQRAVDDAGLRAKHAARSSRVARAWRYTKAHPGKAALRAAGGVAGAMTVASVLPVALPTALVGAAGAAMGAPAATASALSAEAVVRRLHSHHSRQGKARLRVETQAQVAAYQHALEAQRKAASKREKQRKPATNGRTVDTPVAPVLPESIWDDPLASWWADLPEFEADEPFPTPREWAQEAARRAIPVADTQPIPLTVPTPPPPPRRATRPVGAPASFPPLPVPVTALPVLPTMPIPVTSAPVRTPATSTAPPIVPERPRRAPRRAVAPVGQPQPQAQRQARPVAQPGQPQPQPQARPVAQPGQPQQQARPVGQPGQQHPQPQPRLVGQPGQPQQQSRSVGQPGQPQPQQQSRSVGQPGQPQPQQQSRSVGQPGQQQPQQPSRPVGQPGRAVEPEQPTRLNTGRRRRAASARLDAPSQTGRDGSEPKAPTDWSKLKDVWNRQERQ